MTRSRVILTVSLLLSVTANLLSGAALLFVAGILGGSGLPASSSFEAQVRAYLLDNPEIIIESVELLDSRQAAAETNELKLALGENREAILNSASSPVGGNPTGDVSIVEFFDYNCPYCRKAAPMLTDATAADPGLRIVYKEWPILGPGSQFAARAALSAQAQGKYAAFHNAMMAHSGSIDDRVTMAIAADVGLDVERLKGDMDDPSIAAEIERNFSLSEALRITGTPTFVVGDEIVRGLVDLATLQQFVADARKQR